MTRSKPTREPDERQLLAAPVSVLHAIPDGWVADFLTGRILRDTPEEYVRQNVERAFVRQYRYSAHDCEPEYRIKVGSSRKYVDVAIFLPESEHKQANVYIVIETKRQGTAPSSRSDGIGQLHSYMAACVNAQFGLWTNGDERLCYAKRHEHGEFRFEEIIEIPALGQTEAEAQRPQRKDLVVATGDNLLFAFRRCHNYITGTEGKQKPEAFWELLKLIFAKIEDERSPQLDFFVTATERSSGTAAQSAKVRIQKLFATKVVSKYPQIFPRGDTTIDLKANVVAYVVSQLQSFSLLRSPVDVKGVAYEEIVGANLRGDRGEFFTPRNACRMAISMLDPGPDERLLDPACGTGGFLIAAMNYALEHIERTQRRQWTDPSRGSQEEYQELHHQRMEYLAQRVHGIDLNPGLVRAAKMNMVMNNDGEGGLFPANSLANPHTWDPDLGRRSPLGSFDVLVTNPPFGANILIDQVEVLEQYELAGVWDRQVDGRWIVRLDIRGQRVLQKSLPPEILFIERCVQFLVKGTGRLAMVIPNGILNNPALGYVRQWILENAQVLAVVDMARELFQPKNDTQTSMVLLRRLSDDERAIATEGKLDYGIFMAIAERIGHDKRGNVLYRRTPDGDDVLIRSFEQIADIDPATGQEVLREVETSERQIDDELPEVARAYLAWVAEQRR